MKCLDITDLLNAKESSQLSVGYKLYFPPHCVPKYRHDHVILLDGKYTTNYTSLEETQNQKAQQNEGFRKKEAQMFILAFTFINIDTKESNM